MTLALLLEQLFNGVQFGLMLFLMAVGVTLVFGIMRVINLARKRGWMSPELEELALTLKQDPKSTAVSTK